jgi:hypothetical protein
MMTRKLVQAVLVGLLSLVAAAGVLAQMKVQHERRPPASPNGPLPLVQPQPAYDYFSILDGTPRALALHHDTEVGTNKPIDVYMFAIELQVMNSDGNLEPEGLIIDNFYTARAIHPNKAPNPHNARDCKIWNSLVLDEINNRKGGRTWPYVEFTVAKGARVIQTNEDGQVWWSDDVECWASKDRFKPF